MSIPETFYIALCVTILLLGVVYWFWTQVQYLQRKVNLLDNVVYEMKTLVSNLPGPQMTQKIDKEEEEYETPIQESYAPPPESVAGDLEAERLVTEMEFDTFSGSAPIQPLKEEDVKENVTDDLQPGGLASASSDKKESDSSIESPLSGMSIKELRRMAEANGVPGSGELRKKELIRALRDKVSGIINESKPNVISFDEIDAPGSE
jgi:hypothetical protein